MGNEKMMFAVSRAALNDMPQDLRAVLEKRDDILVTDRMPDFDDENIYVSTRIMSAAEQLRQEQRVADRERAEWNRNIEARKAERNARRGR